MHAWNVVHTSASVIPEGAWRCFACQGVALVHKEALPYSLAKSGPNVLLVNRNHGDGELHRLMHVAAGSKADRSI